MQHGSSVLWNKYTVIRTAHGSPKSILLTEDVYYEFFNI